MNKRRTSPRVGSPSPTSSPTSASAAEDALASPVSAVFLPVDDDEHHDEEGLLLRRPAASWAAWFASFDRVALRARLLEVTRLAKLGAVRLWAGQLPSLPSLPAELTPNAARVYQAIIGVLVLTILLLLPFRGVGCRSPPLAVFASAGMPGVSAAAAAAGAYEPGPSEGAAAGAHGSPPPPPRDIWYIPEGGACSSPNPGDIRVAACQPICAEKFARAHCGRCKCRACSFCPHVDDGASAALNGTVDRDASAPAAVEPPGTAAAAAGSAAADTEAALAGAADAAAAALEAAGTADAAAAAAAAAVAEGATWLSAGSECTSTFKGDERTSSCMNFCNSKFVSAHCQRCKCRSCDFCPRPLKPASSYAALNSTSAAVPPTLAAGLVALADTVPPATVAAAASTRAATSVTAGTEGVAEATSDTNPASDGMPNQASTAAAEAAPAAVGATAAER